MRFERALEELYRGQMSFTEFARITKPRWSALAGYIARRWRQPLWSSVEDLEQELLMGAWQYVWRFEPCMGVRIERFVIYNAVDRAKKAAHRTRGASLSGSADRNPSHIERPFASWSEEGEHALEAMLADEPTQTRVLEQRDSLEGALAACRAPGERAVVEGLLRTGSLLECALALYQDPTTRLAWRFNSEDHAFWVVEQLAATIADRLDAAA
jgi:DNA-directed RNA polymerase specialized sigma24 family protein